jgi:hypothetical protein
MLNRRKQNTSGALYSPGKTLPKLWMKLLYSINESSKRLINKMTDQKPLLRIVFDD